jgi:hypothetical protein
MTSIVSIEHPLTPPSPDMAANFTAHQGLIQKAMSLFKKVYEQPESSISQQTMSDNRVVETLPPKKRRHLDLDFEGQTNSSSGSSKRPDLLSLANGNFTEKDPITHSKRPSSFEERTLKPRRLYLLWSAEENAALLEMFEKIKAVKPAALAFYDEHTKKRRTVNAVEAQLRILLKKQRH